MTTGCTRSPRADHTDTTSAKYGDVSPREQHRGCSEVAAHRRRKLCIGREQHANVAVVQGLCRLLEQLRGGGTTQRTVEPVVAQHRCHMIGGAFFAAQHSPGALRAETADQQTQSVRADARQRRNCSCDDAVVVQQCTVALV